MKKIFILVVLMFIILSVPNKVKADVNVKDLYCKYIYLDDSGAEGEPCVYEVSNEEYEILCRIVEAEATGGNISQKKNVASCVMARVESKDWADTIKGVVFQHFGNNYQFTPIVDGRYYTVKITDATRQAVSEVLQNGKTHSCQFFCSMKSYEKQGSWHRNSLTYVFYDGEHVYCN